MTHNFRSHFFTFYTVSRSTVRCTQSPCMGERPLSYSAAMPAFTTLGQTGKYSGQWTKGLMDTRGLSGRWPYDDDVGDGVATTEKSKNR
ncbi:hypothetical protein TcasGA2_TC011781 [Tribolium castaneum]|uniref:Uncharacterized protein n=1 Tax=Tribolium castaneum TaxID=7070 RepID=D6WZR8_TRICA|nr:hypothetical protein TcasGA2_TC011781 [Tribolium castaneum]